jgi:hypothetical protein
MASNTIIVGRVNIPKVKTTGKKFLEDLRLNPKISQEILIEWSVGLLYLIPEIKIRISGIFLGSGNGRVNCSDLFVFPQDEIVIPGRQEPGKIKIIYSDAQFVLKVDPSVKPGYYTICCLATYCDHSRDISGNFKFSQKLAIRYNA